MACGITSGFAVDCDSITRTGGVNKRAWVYNISDLSPSKYTFDADGCVTAINFAQNGLYEIDSRKSAHSGGYTQVTGGDGGNKYFQHDVILKLFSKDCLSDKTIEELLVADIGIILETNNQEFKIYGGNNGMDQISAVQNSGQVAGSDIADTLTFMGEESKLPYRVEDTDYPTTLTYLDSLVV